MLFLWILINAWVINYVSLTGKCQTVYVYVYAFWPDLHNSLFHYSKVYRSFLFYRLILYLHFKYSIWISSSISRCAFIFFICHSKSQKNIKILCTNCIPNFNIRSEIPDLERHWISENLFCWAYCNLQFADIYGLDQQPRLAISQAGSQSDWISGATFESRVTPSGG